MWNRRPAREPCGSEEASVAPGGRVGRTITEHWDSNTGKQRRSGGSWVGLRGPEEQVPDPQGRLEALGNRADQPSQEGFKSDFRENFLTAAAAASSWT